MQAAQQFPTMIGQAQSVFMPGTQNLTQLYSQNLSLMAPYSFANPNIAGSAIGSSFQANAANATQMAGYDNSLAIAQLQADTQMAINTANNAFSSYWNQQQQLWATQNRGIELAANAQAQQSAQRNSWLNAGVGVLGAVASIYGTPAAGAARSPARSRIAGSGDPPRSTGAGRS
jgi:hypothetical protein